MPILERDDMLASWSELYRNPYIATCDAPHCNFHLAASSEPDALQKLASHICPYLGGPTTIGPALTATLVEQCWDDMDRIMDTYMSIQDDHPEKVMYKGQLRGMATLLARFMVPHYSTADEIAKECKLRYDARQKGTKRDTLGIHNLRYTPPSASKYDGGPSNPHPTIDKIATSRRAAAVDKLSEKEKAAIRNAMSVKGMFTPADLAKVYGVSAEVIEMVAAEASV